MATPTRVRELMTADAVTLDRNEDLSLADRIMTLGRIRHMPVLDDEAAWSESSVSATCSSTRRCAPLDMANMLILTESDFVKAFASSPGTP